MAQCNIGMLQKIHLALTGRGKEAISSPKSNPCEANIQICARADVLAKLDSSVGGLLDIEAANRLETNGENVTLEATVPGWKEIARDSIFNCYNVLLVVIIIISVSVPDRDWTLFTIISVVVPLAAALNFYQEFKSVKSDCSSPEEVPPIHVRRQRLGADPKEFLLDPRKLVSGDILLLSAGEVVPADCIVLKSSNLSVSQSSLTGESQPQPKGCFFGDPNEYHPNVFDLPNVIFSGSRIISGSGMAVAFATGHDTYISTMARELNSRRLQNSFQKGINKIVFIMVVFMIIAFAIILVVKGTKSHHWQGAAVFALSTAATLVPELLPAIVTTNLYRGKNILCRKVTVRHMEVIQNLGSMTVLCSDKTGTLTKEDVELSQSMEASGLASSRVFHLAHINAYHQSDKNNAIDSAILSAGSVDDKFAENGTKMGEIPFTFEARRSSCIVRTSTGALKLICKGAYEEVLALCSDIRVGARIEKLNEQNRGSLSGRVDALNAEAFRVILVASRQLSEVEVSDNGDLTGLDQEMTIEGLLTFLDPLKDDAKDSVLHLQKLGVDVRILTGDNLKVAISIARSLDIGQKLDEDEPAAICGPSLAAIQDPEEWNSTVKRCKVFAKLTPAQKGNVIEALQAQGNIVGMVGDGINDAIALSRADVGISVHSGQAVAKQSADIILQEKQLSTIIDAVRVGRITFGNIMKYLNLILAANFGNIISVLVASAWFPFDPISPAQMVLQNLLYDLGQIAIPLDNVDEEYLAMPQGLSLLDVSRFILCIGPITSTIDIAVFLLNTYYYRLDVPDDPVRIQHFQCNWFVQGLLSQILVVYIARTAKIPLFQGRPSKALVISTLTVSIVGFVIPYIPKLNHALNLTPPHGSFICILAAFLVLYAVVIQLVKMLYIKIFKRWL